MLRIACSVFRFMLFVFLLLCVACFVIRIPSHGLAWNGMWSTPFNCSQSIARSEDASIAVDANGWVHVVWSENGQILHRVRDEYGWSAITTVTSGHSPSLAADRMGNVYMAFAAQSYGADDVYFASWCATSGWSLPINVSQSNAQSALPQIAVADDGELAIVWSEQAADWTPIFLGRSMEGELWLTMPVPNAYGSCPELAFGSAGELWVAWQDVLDVGFPAEIFASQWTGSEWTLPEDVSYSFETDSILPSMAVSQGKVYLAWQEGNPGEEAIYWVQWVDGAWDWPQKRSGAGRAFAPALAVGGAGYGHLVWTTEGAVQYASWDTSTGAWESVENVALGQTGAIGARLAVDHMVHAAWLAEASGSNLDVYYSRREAVAATPTAAATLTATPTITATPSALPTATATPTAILTLTATRSATPTQTVTVTPSPTLVATATLTLAPFPSTRIFLPLMLRMR
ncbi:MAG: hypothetical protein ACP5Q1_07570 [Anaerolineae bacterium]